MTDKNCPFATNKHGVRLKCNDKCALYDTTNECCSIRMLTIAVQNVDGDLDALRKQLKNSGGLSKLMEG